MRWAFQGVASSTATFWSIRLAPCWCRPRSPSAAPSCRHQRSEWGADVSANLSFVRSSPWTALGPGFAILITVLSFNLIGDSLADWFNPRRRSAA